jgi:D-sedoheptulose 7-phosphate isomerase
MNKIEYFKKYFSVLNLSLNSVNFDKLVELSCMIKKANKSSNQIILAGNGGSSSIASHLTVDLINAANIRAINFNEPSIITCFANDYGYKNWVAKALDCYANNGDVVILISSSGQSENMLIAAKKAKDIGMSTVTLSGFSKNNPLRTMGDVNFWVDSSQYNIVEMAHHIWLLSVVDYIIANKNKEL